MLSSRKSSGIAYGYVRVSTVYQRDDGISLDVQKKRIAEYCKYRKIENIKYFEDAGFSGKNMKRPKLLELLEIMKSGDYVIVCDLSRLSRNPRDALELLEKFKERKILFTCLSPEIDFTTPIGEMIFTVLMAVHKLERQNIAQHVSNNLKMLSKEGKLRSKPPFGYKFIGKGKDFEIVPEQQEVIELIKKWYKNEMTITQITNKLNDEGYDKCISLNKKKNVEMKFHPEMIRRILVDHDLIKRKGILINRKEMEKRK